MGILGFLIQLATAAYLGYLGYTVQLNYILILISPLGFIIGSVMRKSANRSSKSGGGFFTFLTDLLSGYVVGLVIAAACWGAGYGLMHVLGMRPPPGTGRI